jgi:hypothetical protein
MKETAKIVTAMNKFGLACRINRVFTGGASLVPLEGRSYRVSRRGGSRKS